MKVVAIVQARMGSTRLPAKVLRPLGPWCVLEWVVRRLRCAVRIDSVLVATSTLSSDDPIVDRCQEWGVETFRGSESDVLGRFVGALESCKADLVIRVNADNPLVDPSCIDLLVDSANTGGGEYVSFRRGDGRPAMLSTVGFYAEAVSRSCLLRADAELADSTEREHVTLGIYSRPDRFHVRWLRMPACCDDPRFRFTLDTAADLALLDRVVAALGKRAETANVEEVTALVKTRIDWLDTMAELNRASRKSYN